MHTARRLRDARTHARARDATHEESPACCACVAQRERVTSRALQDVDNLRRLVYNDLDQLEGLAAGLEESSSVQRWWRGRAMADLKTIRKIAASDLNVLELQILQGDPTLTFLRDALRKLNVLPQPQLGPSQLAPGVRGFWLREQFERGALRDPALISALLEQARLNPEVVVRLVSEAKDRAGRDLSVS